MFVQTNKIYTCLMLHFIIGSNVDKFLGLWNGITDGDKRGGMVFCYRVANSVFGTYVLNARRQIKIRDKFRIVGTDIIPLEGVKSPVKGTYMENGSISWTMASRQFSIWVRYGSYLCRNFLNQPIRG